MPVDASIPLAAGQTQWAPNPQQTMSLMEFAQNMKQRQQQTQAQNALRQIFADPSNLDANGQLRPDAIGHIMQIDPNTGMALRQQSIENAMRQSTIDKNAAQRQAADTERQLKLLGHVQTSVVGPALEAYDDAKKKGMSDQAADEAAQAVFSDALKELSGSGLFHPDEFSRIPQQFDVKTARAGNLTYKDYLANQKKDDAEPKMRTRISGDQEIQEEWDAKGNSWKEIGRGPRFAKQVPSVVNADSSKGWEIKEGVDDKGKPQFVRINKATGESIPVVGATPNRKLSTASESERKAAMNYTTMKNAEGELEKLAGQGVDKLAFLSTVQRDEHGYLSAADRFGRNRALTPDEQLVAQAALQFAEGAGHLKSGARINNETMGIITNLYIPMPGDSKEVIARKQAARRNDIVAARVGGGRAVEALEEGEKGDADPGSANDFSHLWK